MTANISIHYHKSKLDKCAKIIDMIRLNRHYMQADMEPGEKLITLFGVEYYRNRVKWRMKIQNRLTAYYIKNIAAICEDGVGVLDEILNNK